MSHPPDDARKGPTDRAGGLPSARDGAAGGSEAESSRRGRRGGSGRGKRRGRSRKPTSARAATAVEATDPVVEPDAPEASLQVGDHTWTVRVLGRSGGSHPGATPMLLLGFWAPDSGEEGHTREALTVGRTLAELSDFDLCAAHARSDPPPDGRGGFFGESAERRR